MPVGSGRPAGRQRVVSERHSYGYSTARRDGNRAESSVESVQGASRRGIWILPVVVLGTMLQVEGIALRYWTGVGSVT